MDAEATATVKNKKEQEGVDLSDPMLLELDNNNDDSSESKSLSLPPSPIINDVIMGYTDSDIEYSDGALPKGLSDYDYLEDSDEDNGNEPDTSDVTWRKGFTMPEAIPFTGSSGIQVEMHGDTPMEYLHLMVDDSMVDSIVIETNRYAAAFLREIDLTPCSRFQKWVDVTRGEMWTFLGIVIAMGLIVVEDLEDYWCDDERFSLPFFRSVMRKDRFSLIVSFFHVCNNEECPPKHSPDYDPLYKIRKFVDKLTWNFKSVFTPGENVTIDDVVIARRGSIPFKFKVHKSDKKEIKVYELCDSKTGYCCNLELFADKSQCSSHGVDFDVISRLILPYTGCGRTLYLDNKYTCPDLFSYLKEKQTLACGTYRPGQKGPPKNMLSKEKKDTITTFTNGIVNFIHFFDKKRDVHMLTTAHDDSKITTVKRKDTTMEPVVKLKAGFDYDKQTGAVGRTVQMGSCNAFKRCSLKWWKKPFFHMFTLGVLNAYFVHKATARKKLSHRIFRRDLVMQLVHYSSLESSPIAGPSCVGESALSRLQAYHFISVIPVKPGAKGQHPQRDCVVCSQPNKRKQSRYECRPCNVGLHIDPCFQIYHTHEDFKEAFKKSAKQISSHLDDNHCESTE